MILKFLCVPKLYRLDILTMVKGILFIYCLLASLCIKAALDNDVCKSINIDKKEEEWFFMFAPNSDVSGHREDFCYIAMINKRMMVSESTGREIRATLMALQFNNVEEIPNANNCQSLTYCSAKNLSEIEYNNFLCELNSEHKTYKYALIVIFTCNEDDDLISRIEQIELYNTVCDKNIMINDPGNIPNILKPLFESCKHIRSVPKNNSQSNNAEDNINNDLCSDLSNPLFLLFEDIELAFKNSAEVFNEEISYVDLLFDDQELNVYPDNISLFNNEVDIDPENNCGELLGVNVKEVHLLREHGRIGEANVSGCKKPEKTKPKRKQIHKCYICGRVCVAQYHLIEHMYIHSKDKQYKCDWSGCDKEFSLKSNFTTHLKKYKHYNPFQCKWCDKKFVHRSSLNAHIVVHTSEQGFKCTFCSKFLSCKQTLDSHIKIHENEKKFSCLQCDKKFNTYSSLAKHIEIHSGYKKYRCVHNGCKMAFFYNYSLTRHMITHKKVKAYK